MLGAVLTLISASDDRSRDIIYTPELVEAGGGAKTIFIMITIDLNINGDLHEIDVIAIPQKGELAIFKKTFYRVHDIINDIDTGRITVHLRIE